MIKGGLDMDYVKTRGSDKYGRPIVWLIMKDFRPEVMNRETAIRLMCYIMDYVCT